MRTYVATALMLALSGSAFADDTCFDVSAHADTWSKTPEVLCVSKVKDADYTLALRTGIPGSQQEVVTMHLNLLARVRCIDCNKDVFGLANPSNSVVNALQVKFDGKRDSKTMQEKGTVMIGATRLYYRGKAATAPVIPPPLPPTTTPTTPTTTTKTPPPTKAAVPLPPPMTKTVPPPPPQTK